jgi:toxin-antitoxin system PIN domain toxin
MSRRKGPAAALLDTNVLLALAWPNHQHHAAAHAWFAQNASTGWATCALTQLGFVRLSSNPAYTRSSVTPSEAASLLHEMTVHPSHDFGHRQ